MNFWWPFGISAETREAARVLLHCANTAARAPELYTDGGVPDTLDGRFQLLGLFTALTLREIEDKKLRQALFDVLFQFCETGLRELGVGDIGIPYKLKAMMKAFHGHALQYEAACADSTLWNDALSRNVYGTLDAAPTFEQLAVLRRHIDEYMAAYYDDAQGEAA